MKRTSLSPVFGLASLLLASGNARPGKADVSNAGHLMGDVSLTGPYGEVYDGLLGDVSTSALDTYNTLIGDTYDDGDYGDVKRRRAPRSNTFRKIATGAAIAGGGTLASVAVSNAIKRAKLRKAAVARTEAENAAANTIQNQVAARRLLGKIPRTTLMPFFQVSGASLNSYPLAPTEAFAANDLKFNLDLQSTQTPFEVEIVNGTYAGVTWTLTAPGVVAARYYPCVLITVGISTLTANPGTIFTVAGSMPIINGGTLSISSNPFSFTIAQGWYAKLIIFPWVLVTNKPLLALGSYNNAAPIVFTLTGLPSNATVNMIVPGSQHVWTIGMRNRLS